MKIDLKVLYKSFLIPPPKFQMESVRKICSTLRQDDMTYTGSLQLCPLQSWVNAIQDLSLDTQVSIPTNLRQGLHWRTIRDHVMLGIALALSPPSVQRRLELRIGSPYGQPPDTGILDLGRAVSPHQLSRDDSHLLCPSVLEGSNPRLISSSCHWQHHSGGIYSETGGTKSHSL